MIKKQNKRIENKILLDESDYSYLINCVQSIPYFFKTTHEDRYVNSIYYDTISYQCVEDNLSGISKRHKTRLRWYNAINKVDNPYLEYKIKTGALGIKKRLPLNININLSDYRHSQLINLIENELDVNNKLLYQNFNYGAVVIIRYKRSYYESITHKIRITIDSDLQFYSQLNYDKINIEAEIKKNRILILEIKYNEDLIGYVSDILQYLPYRVTKCSKYLMAVMSIKR
jgi:SPX domain protein involved in polyphosphate accumulation